MKRKHNNYEEKTKGIVALSLTLSVFLSACGQKQETTSSLEKKKVHHSINRNVLFIF